VTSHRRPAPRLPVVTGEPFERVVEHHGDTVLRVCRAVLGRSAAADDAWSETFLSALRAYPSLPAGSNIEAWLVTIAHRRALDQVRAAARRPIPMPDPPDRPATDPLADPQNHPRLGGEVDDLWAAVAALAPRQRQTIAYHYLAGLPYTEVARLIGGTPTAARRAAADGIATLRRNYPGPTPPGSHQTGDRT